MRSPAEVFCGGAAVRGGKVDEDDYSSAVVEGGGGRASQTGGGAGDQRDGSSYVHGVLLRMKSVSTGFGLDGQARKMIASP
jgi:hypothetical protein